MSTRCSKGAGLIVAAIAGWLPAVAHAQTAAGPEGAYCLRGVHEVGSCLRLSPDSRFEYFLAYGAYDERSEGHWKADGADVVLDSPAYDKAPTFTFKGFQPADDERFAIVVVSKGGNRLNGINVRADCDGRAVEGVTGGGGDHLDCVHAPKQVALGLKMFGVPYQSVPVPAPAGAEKAYVFEFDPGDLGSKRFAATRLRREGADTLVMTYANPVIAELDAKTFTYERERE